MQERKINKKSRYKKGRINKKETYTRNMQINRQRKNYIERKINKKDKIDKKEIYIIKNDR